MNTAGDLYVGMVFGGFVAALWSFLMARYVAGPRAKTLMVGTLRGDTTADKEIVAEIRENLVRPEIRAALENFKMPDMAPVMAKLDDISELEVPEFDFSPVISRFDALEQTLPDTISSHIDMHMKALRAAEAKNIGKMVDELNIEGLTEEARTEAIERLSTKQKLAYQLMTMKVPKTVKGDHPLSTALFEQSRGTIAQYLIELDDQASGKVGVESASKGSFGVR